MDEITSFPGVCIIDESSFNISVANSSTMARAFIYEHFTGDESPPVNTLVC